VFDGLSASASLYPKEGVSREGVKGKRGSERQGKEGRGGYKELGTVVYMYMVELQCEILHKLLTPTLGDSSI